MEHETKKSSVKKMKQAFLAGFAVVGLLLLTLNFQIAGLSDEIGQLNTVLTGAVPGQQEGDSGTQPSQGDEQPQAPSGDVDMEQLVGDATYKGDSDAPVTIVEWSDFACPFCDRFYDETLGQIEENYVETGQVKFIYRHFPVVGGDAQAEAAVCADEQGIFWEFHDRLFDRFDQYSPSEFPDWVEEFGGDSAEFQECLDSGRATEVVENDQQLGVAAGVQGTPGFVINGELVSGAQPYREFERVIESKLN